MDKIEKLIEIHHYVLEAIRLEKDNLPFLLGKQYLDIILEITQESKKQKKQYV
jgi:hypothetical protein